MSETTKNNFNKKVQMHLACLKGNDQRKDLECVYFNNGFAYATNQEILVKNRIDEISGLEPHEIEALNGKFLHADFYKEMLKYDSIMIAEDGIECTKDDNKAFFYFSKFEKYPDAERVLSNALRKPPVALPEVSFDMKLIQRLNKALYRSDRCTARFKGVGEPIVFDSMEADVSSVGLIISFYRPD